MLKNLVQLIGGDPNQKAIEAYSETVDYINSLEAELEGLSEEELRGKTAQFRQRLAEGESQDDIMAEAFATVREVSKRTLGLRPYDVQLIGAIGLHEGKIAEMRTGEGKTLSATMPLYLNALEGKGAHLVTVNDYLARRDARWMAPIYDFLGLSVGVLQMGSGTEGGKNGFVVNLEKESNHEDQHQLETVSRREAYLADITYGTNNEFGFDYLRDNMKMTMEERAQRPHHYAIIDEVDNVLIDEARTPLIISGPAHDDAENYLSMAQVVKRLNPEDYEVNEKDKTATLTEIGQTHLEQLLGVALSDPERPEDITPEQARLLGFVEQAMRAQFLFHRNKDYLVQGGKVVIVDEFTGRLMPGRRWSDGLHQAVEAKEGVKVESENVTYATVTIQNYFRMYKKLAGMTGTALTEAEEFSKIYDLEVIAIPPNVDYIASQEDGHLETREAVDEYGYRYTYYSLKDDPENLPYLWRRKDYPDVVYRSVEAKLRAIVREIIQYHVMGRPILVGTTSVESSDQLSSRMKADMVQRVLQVLLIRDVWMEKHDRIEDGRGIRELADLNEPLDKLNLTEMRKQARELDLNLNLQSEENTARLLSILGLSAEDAERLNKVIQGGVPHEVLNARRHTEESQIIAGAGAFGAVTIATNMAGRGVDIKLGGEIAEEILSAVARVLSKAGHDDPYDLSLEERKGALEALSEGDYGIYKSEIRLFLQSMKDMAKVKELGGLHVIGSERHEARRIDNQLRGRAARQGDPGSSRFYLSLQDDLMRLFGGQQVEGMMTRMNMDDAVPLEMGLVSRIIESSQTRVEGANFDAREHLLDYDDVLNSQRETVYEQRDRIMARDDLSDDVTEMLETEVNERVPLALVDEDGPWKLLAWLEQIQPSLVINQILLPSFTYQLLIDHLKELRLSSLDKAKAALVDMARKSIKAEEEHLVRSVEELHASSELRLQEQIDERLDTLDTFIEGLSLADETDTRSPSELATELDSLMHMPLKLNGQQQKLLREDPEQAADVVQEKVEDMLHDQAVTRLVGAVERRLDSELELDSAELAEGEWDAVGTKLLDAIRSEYQDRMEKLVGDNDDGQVAVDVDKQLEKSKGQLNDAALLNSLIMMPQGTVTTFDKKTHQRVQKRTTRLSYAFYAATFLDSLSEEEITEKVLAHLKNVQHGMRTVWGLSAWEMVSKQQANALTDYTRAALEDALGADSLKRLNGNSLDELDDAEKQKAVEALGRKALTESYRHLMLRVISELWVEYLTQMEALRVSVRLEAYAQRDPLVEYKAQAFRMFQQLFSDMRSSVVNRMFTYRPSNPQQAVEALDDGAQASESGNGAGIQAAPQPAPAKQQEKKKSGGRKRRRRRRRRN